MLVIRLKRIGRKNKPYYRLVVQEKSKAPSSSVVEEIGTFNPHTDPATIDFNKERVEYWISQGAKASATVHNMLVNEGVIKGDKQRVVQPKIKEKEGGEEEKKPEAKPEEGKEDKPAEEKKEEVKEEEKK
ncbi:30S ribosomal protein S16 [Patescibacteria group bacterium]|nr:30S ribosomal protein S16 [Patescibacteria group bacterium]MBU1673176.1 30S ribosomal protein S16 [Patescibacteria group bacterium]MBU1963333.1 30S ribosomal protein S16 [Patescibacteria group bacterium]